MAKCTKKTLNRKDVAYLLRKLYFVSHRFSSEQYETYVHSTYLYLVYTDFAQNPMDYKSIFMTLFVLANSFRTDHVLEDDVQFNSILDTYFN